MKITPELKKKISTIARMYEAFIKGQAKTSEIAAGTTVVPIYGDNTIELSVVLADEVFYGIFLDQGTGPYYSRTAERGPFNPNPPKGTGGIIPRFWMSLSETMEERFNQMIEDAIAEEQEKEIDLILD